MLVPRHRLAMAGVITAAVIAVPAAAMASSTGSPSGKPTPPSASAAIASKSAAAQCQPAGSPSGKPAPPRGSALASKYAAAQAVPQPPVTGPAAVSALATRLNVSATTAGRAFKEIGGLLVETGRVDTASPAFAAIARELGVSPAQLATAWDAVEHSGAGG